MVVLHGREPIINTPPHLSRHSKRISQERAVPARGALEEGEKIWYYPALRIHKLSERASEIKCWERWSVYESIWADSAQVGPSGLLQTSPVQSSPGQAELGIGPIPVQELLGLDWTGLGQTQSGLVHCWTGGIIEYKCDSKKFPLQSFIDAWSMLN